MATEPFEIRLDYGLAGQSFIFNSENMSNFVYLYDYILAGGSCNVSLEYSGDTYYGTISIVGNEFLVTFDTRIVAPAGSCIVVECHEKEEETDCKDVEIPFSEDLRLAVLDDKGCLMGWIRLGDIFKEITHPDTLCKLYKVDGVPQGHLTASDRILTVDDSCMIKSIPATDIVCD